MFVSDNIDSLKIKKLLSKGYKAGYSIRMDSDILTTKSIKAHILETCRMWEQLPWSHEVPISIFQQHVLPYKVSVEYPDNWRQTIRKILIDSNRMDNLSMYNDDSNKRMFINQKIQEGLWPLQSHWYHYSDEAIPAGTFPSFNEIRAWGKGNCYIGSQFGVYFGRAMGIPMAADFIPYFGGINGNHALEVHWDPQTGKLLKLRPYDIPVTKAFRHTFEHQGEGTKI